MAPSLLICHWFVIFSKDLLLNILMTNCFTISCQNLKFEKNDIFPKIMHGSLTARAF